ncbi:MAG: TIGR02117 family protein [Desulfocapsa sp.]|nr:TIGR02117 family protein [Desulfocapsa sp.]MBN4048664.1 TIGR02117 family protein [bacterium AH-315-N22]
MKRVFLLFVFLLHSACQSKPYVVKETEENTAEENVAIYVVSHGWHTGIVVPAGKIQSNLPQLWKRFGKTPYIEFGWGDKVFYQAEETTIFLTLRALFWPTESVIHAVAIAEKVDLLFPGSQVEKLCLSSSGYSSLIRFITNSFYKNEQSDIIQLQSGIYGNSQFYQGEGCFYLMNTCNNWTAKALKSAGMDMSPAFKLTSASVMDYIVEYNQTLKSGSSGEAGSAAACP